MQGEMQAFPPLPGGSIGTCQRPILRYTCLVGAGSCAAEVLFAGGAPGLVAGMSQDKARDVASAPRARSFRFD